MTEPKQASLKTRSDALVWLVSPPAYYPWSVPPGLAYLSGYLSHHGIRVQVVDANVEALEHVLANSCGDHAQIGAAFQVLRDKASFHNWHRFAAAMSLLSSAARELSSRSDERLMFERNTFRYFPGFERRSRRGLLEAASNPARHLFIRYFEDVLIPRLRRESPAIVGISASDLHQLLPATVLAAVLRHHLGSDCPQLVLGGNVFSRIADVLSRHDDLNRELFQTWGSVIVGEAERGLLELVQAVERGIPGDDVEGLVAPGRSPRKLAPITLDSLPSPRCDGFHPLSPELPVPLNVYRGCYFSGVCQFCDINHGYDSVWTNSAPELSRSQRRQRHIDRILDDIRQSIDCYGTTLFNFTDEWFPARDMLALAERLIDAGIQIRWDAYARFEPLLTDPDIATTLFRGGLRFLQFGLETASISSLKRIRKGITPELSSTVLRTTAAAGIWNHVFVIVGLPGETLHDSLLTVDFLRVHSQHILTVKPTRFRVSRWSPMTRTPAAFGIEVDSALLAQRDLALDLPFRYVDVSPARDVEGANANRHGRALSHRAVNAMYESLELFAAEHWAYGFTSLYPYHTRLLFSDADARKIAAERTVDVGLKESAVFAVVGRYLRAECEQQSRIRRVYSATGSPFPEHLKSVDDLCTVAAAWAHASSQFESPEVSESPAHSAVNVFRRDADGKIIPETRRTALVAERCT